MADVQIPVTVPKEFNDVLAAITQLLVAIKAKQVSLTTELEVLVGLVNEFSALPAQLKGEPGACVDAAALQVRQMVWALLELQK